MRNKKNDANGFYLCISDLVVDGVLMCTAGKRYRIQDAESGPGEAPAEVAGYCDIFGCENSGVCMATWLDVGEHFRTDWCAPRQVDSEIIYILRMKVLPAHHMVLGAMQPADSHGLP